MPAGDARQTPTAQSLADAGEAFALLDDEVDSGATRLYLDWVQTLVCPDAAHWPPTWATAQARMAAERLHAVIVADYDAGQGFVDLPPDARAQGAAGIEVLLFRRRVRPDAAATAQFLGAGAPTPAGISGLTPSLDRAAYGQAIDRVQEHIRAGDTYQVNLTYRLRGRAWGHPVALYRRLRQRQAVPFGALIHRPDSPRPWIVSRSPELFARSHAGTVTARPMKGTAPRDRDPERDLQLARWLAADPKNRAENLMIVDLLRNDLGRLAEIGSVHVPALFSVERYATVHQMTSTVQARLRPEVGFAEVFAAIFPCGSITGAPKRQTMQIIRELEDSPRGLYCGAIGWVDPPLPQVHTADAARSACPDFCLSVAIRTLVLGPSARRDGARDVELGVGGGIVLDSTAQSEWEETRVKARFVTRADPGITLFETMLARPGRGIRNLAGHRARLTASASALGWPIDEAAVTHALQRVTAYLRESDGPQRVRLDLAFDAQVAVRTQPLGALPRPSGGDHAAAGDSRARDADVLVTLGLWPDEPALTLLRGHKHSARTALDLLLADAVREGAFDVLLFDGAGDDALLVEGARSSVFIRLDGRWRTSPADGTRLPGTMRARLLARCPRIELAAITRRDVHEAEAIVLTNAVRGVLRARLATR